MYEYRAKVLRIIDGDTLKLEIDLGLKTSTKQKVRLAGIDTPETYGVKKNSEEYKAGMLSKARLALLLGSNELDYLKVKTIKDQTGKYGRYLVEIFVMVNGKEINVNQTLLSEGYARFADY